jgi:adenine-specific DNA-methyltransferase
MPTLNWIGKQAVVKHHKEVPFRLLEPLPELSLPSPAGRGAGGEGDHGGNLIVQGDNLHALKALLPRYAGQVKCIYIDPPYNTGNEGWVYNDNVNSPEIRRWLGEVVGKEGETLDRHDRWLCMMYPRLVLLRQFLREDGAIFVSIDDNEVATLRLLMDEIFGARISSRRCCGRRSIRPRTRRVISRKITITSSSMPPMQRCGSPICLPRRR